MRHTSIKLSQFFLATGLLSYFSCALANNHDYYQIKLGAGVFNTSGGLTSAPVISLGKRFEVGDAAVEISTAWANHTHSNNDKFSYFTLPKITYVQFNDPQAPSGFFYGGGLSYSKVKYSANYLSDHANSKFYGLSGEGSVGYEFKRNAAICPILSVDVSQPLLAESKEGRHPGPAVLVGMSVGF